MAAEWNEKLLEPLKYYESELKEHFRQVTINYFENLAQKSGVSQEDSAQFMKEYNELARSTQDLEGSFSTYKFFRGVCKILLWGSAIWALWEYFLASYPDSENIFWCAVVFILSGAIYLLKIAPSIAELKDKIGNLESHMAEMRRKGYEMMDPLNALFHGEMTHELIKKAIPFIHLDPNFDMKRFSQLVESYGLNGTSHENISTLDISSGTILGNPFIFVKRLIHEMGDYTYTGERVVQYVESYRDSNGKLRHRTVTETLHASVTKPGPYYSNIVSLVYGNDAAPNLSFSREASGKKGEVSGLWDKFKLNREISEIRDKTRDAIKMGGTFQGMANEKFDARFHALDRDNEQEFRLLFTPLAQENIEYIFDHSPYGDDFDFEKNKKINVICAKNTANWKFDAGPFNYIDFNFESIKDNFINFNCDYFDHMFFSFLPLLSIPLYQQMMAQDYIYHKNCDYNYNFYVTEMLANEMNVDYFYPSDADVRDNVRAVLKTRPVRSSGDVDTVEVEAHSYRTEWHRDYVPVRAGNGEYYDVPVDWEEYIPVSRKEYMEVSKMDDDGEDFVTVKNMEKYFYSQDYSQKTFAYKNHMVGKVYDENMSITDLVNQIVHP